MPAHTIYCWYIVDNSVKEVYCFTWKSHFGCFRLFRGCFRPFRGCFRPKKKKKQHKKTANIIHRAFLFTWIVHQDLIRIPQNMDKITFRLSFQFPPQADIWGQAEIQALWKIQVYMYTSLYKNLKEHVQDLMARSLWGIQSSKVLDSRSAGRLLPKKTWRNDLILTWKGLQKKPWKQQSGIAWYSWYTYIKKNNMATSPVPTMSPLKT